MTAEPVRRSAGGIGRRKLLVGGSVAAVGAAAAIGLDHVVSPAPSAAATLNGEDTIAFHGAHQAGIDMVPQAHQSLVALTLNPDVDRDGLRRLLSVLTADAERMTQGTHALADSEPEFARVPARLTITVGFGPRVVEIVRGTGAAPSWLGPLPAFTIDRLQDRWNDGDLLLQIASDDPVTVAHTVRMLVKDTRSFAAVRWHQLGFRNAHGSQKPGTTMRNLLGQIDGTVNPTAGSTELADLVWRDDDWLDGGTTMVIRRIEMLQDTWDRLDRSGRESSVGRRLSNGAPLTGQHEHDEPDFEATTSIGFPVIPEFAHIRRARTADETQRIFRRTYNYDLGPSGDKASDAGLVFTSFQRDLEHQYISIQKRLAELDLLNQWTIPIGSAVFAIPSGTRPGEFIGQALFS